ncbi:creatininase family protein [Halomonas vilamensis]|uniref:Creatininase family protein n=1 Tax=Vreelandella vilamensis TaxID=531309 RepID=A0ABU1H1H3_9GAMM|nr:creatininase family protein [Halomonas vilamensis]MDR5897970.1 creatininase family protein [Halomonas vilamensis]
MHFDWHHLTAPELNAMAKRDPVAVLVLGATEQHGAHLPLNTDTTIGIGLQQAMREALSDDITVLCLPPMTLGASDEHASFPGTLSLPARLAIETLEAYGDSLARAGIKRLVLINSHGGNKAVMDLAALTLRRRHGMRVVKATYTRLPPLDAALDADELRRGLHGGALETAIMLYLAPERVNMQRATNTLTPAPDPNTLVGPEGVAPFAWLAEDLSPEGIAGNASQATAMLGERLVHHYGQLLAQVVEETARLPPLAQ